jgi:hypothetical protein
VLNQKYMRFILFEETNARLEESLIFYPGMQSMPSVSRGVSMF